MALPEEEYEGGKGSLSGLSQIIRGREKDLGSKKNKEKITPEISRVQMEKENKGPRSIRPWGGA